MAVKETLEETGKTKTEIRVLGKKLMMKNQQTGLWSGIKNLLNGGLGLAVTVLSLDLLYLYYDNAWYDPMKFIEIAEVIALYILAAGGIVYFIRRVKKTFGK